MKATRGMRNRKHHSVLGPRGAWLWVRDAAAESENSNEPQRREGHREKESISTRPSQIRGKVAFTEPSTPAQHQTSHPLAEHRVIEIEEQAKRPLPEPQLTQQPGLVHRGNRSYGCQADCYFILNHQVCFVRGREREAFITQWHRTTEFEPNPAEAQFVTKTCLIRRRQQTGAKCLANGLTRGEDLIRQTISLFITTTEQTCILRRYPRIRILTCRRNNPLSLPLDSFSPVDESLYALFKQSNIKVQQQTDPPTANSQIRQNLGSMSRDHVLRRLNLQENTVLYQHIEPVTALQLEAFVYDRHILLRHTSDAPQTQFMSQSCLIRRLPFSWPQFLMHLNRSTNNCVGKFIRPHPQILRVASNESNRRALRAAHKPSSLCPSRLCGLFRGARYSHASDATPELHVCL
jgi:hypothetical protein